VELTASQEGICFTVLINCTRVQRLYIILSPVWFLDSRGTKVWKDLEAKGLNSKHIPSSITSKAVG